MKLREWNWIEKGDQKDKLLWISPDLELGLDSANHDLGAFQVLVLFEIEHLKNEKFSPRRPFTTALLRRLLGPWDLRQMIVSEWKLEDPEKLIESPCLLLV